MKKLLLAALLLFSTPAFAGEKLYLYTWDIYAAPELSKKFEKETGIQVITDVYSSNDALMAKLKSGSAYDIVAPSGNYVPLLVAEKLLMPLPEETRALAKGLAPLVQKPEYDPDYTYVLPFAYGTTGLAVNTKLVREDVTTWKQFFERPVDETAGLGVSDDLGTTFDIASLTIGTPFCDGSPATFKALQELLLKQKPFVKVYSWSGAPERMAANEVTMQMAWSGDVFKSRHQNPNIKYVYPKEGVEFAVDNLTIPAGARNVEAAKKYIAFMMRPENAAAFTASAGTMSTVQAAAALLPDDMKNAPEFIIPADAKALPAKACPPEVVKAYSQIWSRVTR